jgi:hypothetical protein
MKLNNKEFVPPHQLNTAVLFIVFNRPNTTKQVFESIRKAKPPRLYVAADGPREDRPGEEEKVQSVRDHIMTNIDWNCDVMTLFRDENLGCKYAVSGAITWLFENEEMGIILEDDCLPSQSFFWFCEELLEKYKDDKRIGLISGNNFQFRRNVNGESYYFSIFNHIWGWASWSRAWNFYDVDMNAWPDFKSGKWLYNIFRKRSHIEYWTNIFDKTYNNEINTWDYQWTFALWGNNCLNIIPCENLISNIGFGIDASHTTVINSFLNNIPRKNIEFPLVHPDFILADCYADGFTMKSVYGLNSRNIFIHKVANIPGARIIWRYLKGHLER